MCTICDKKNTVPFWKDRTWMSKAFDHSDVRIMAAYGLIGGVILAVVLAFAIASPLARFILAIHGLGVIVRAYPIQKSGKDIFWHGIIAAACLLVAATSTVLAILI